MALRGGWGVYEAHHGFFLGGVGKKQQGVITLPPSSSHNHGSVEAMGSWKMCGLSPNGLFSSIFHFHDYGWKTNYFPFGFRPISLEKQQGSLVITPSSESRWLATQNFSGEK